MLLGVILGADPCERRAPPFALATGVFKETHKWIVQRRGRRAPSLVERGPGRFLPFLRVSFRSS